MNHEKLYRIEFKGTAMYGVAVVKSISAQEALNYFKDKYSNIDSSISLEIAALSKDVLIIYTPESSLLGSTNIPIDQLDKAFKLNLEY